MLIKEKDLVLRLTEPDDKDLKNLFQEYEELYNMSELRLYPEDLPTEMVFRIEKNDKLIGEVSFRKIRWYNHKAELSIILVKEAQGKRIGTTALKKIIEYAFNKMNLYRLEAEVVARNTVSKKLVESLGFVLEGTLREAKYINGEYFDILRYGLLKKDWIKK
jgi:RimJ/RimL family protein N-acetyltransferase